VSVSTIKTAVGEVEKEGLCRKGANGHHGGILTEQSGGVIENKEPVSKTKRKQS